MEKQTRTVPLLVVRGGGSAEPEIIISSETLDRQGDVVVQRGGDWSGWMKTGAPVLFAHDARSLPVARGTQLWIDERGQTRARFAWVENDEFASRVRNVFSQGLLAASIGFIPDAYEPLPDGRGLRFTRWRGTEFSLVACPAQEDAIAVTRSLGLPMAEEPAWVLTLADEEPALDDARIAAIVRRELDRRLPAVAKASGVEEPTFEIDVAEVRSLIGGELQRQLGALVQRETRIALNALRGRID